MIWTSHRRDVYAIDHMAHRMAHHDRKESC